MHDCTVFNKTQSLPEKGLMNKNNVLPLSDVWRLEMDHCMLIHRHLCRVYDISLDGECHLIHVKNTCVFTETIVFGQKQQCMKYYRTTKGCWFVPAPF